jgi:hypothetical protein
MIWSAIQWARTARRRRVIVVLAIYLGVAARLVHGDETPAAAPADEYRVKAAILYNIARFVEWPSDAFADGVSPVIVCVVGVDPFGVALDDALQGRTVKGRPVVIRRQHDPGRECHVVFIAYSEQKRIDDIIEQLGSTHVLSMSEVDRFTHRGGVIGLTTVGDRVQFDINVSAAERARLTVSSRLMALASSIHRSGAAAP